MQIHHVSTSNSILNHFLNQIRSVDAQKDRMRFRRNLERIGEIMAYEISKTLDFDHCEVTTPLGIKSSYLISNEVVLCSILRAGLPLHLGFLNYFDEAENGFVAAFRKHVGDGFEIEVGYEAIPDLAHKTLLLLDPMLATGQSIVAVLNQLKLMGTPDEIHIAVVIAAPEGIAFLESVLPSHVHLWIASIDDKLNDKKYIIPGLGDAGDLAYGSKL
ncbi:uracil phosphoribosyltransferase [Flavobacterium branchiophilum NBRC 15030 = ATCC 35035]|uniref:Uracil phosphoribosyltransferase n=1 Tax=Flavobacterium branchiophilum TaxID=55197 RepID=A0A543G3V3_9FLAO|nr:uracil phosphoribosyltransferase [Flavobacterium branchiophilum]OXA82197.1 uracil phosphoribosyltransferase [Flavobacterium branchiophilum NBRC 15030 = ATCC 35035]TQM40758.1 uracil phosphoribosyltransferase [Flavobacterium branchiophilum]GEM55418.1 uracil phosphoribosyltransferase [Flavobacterium branchiophilum NBRC 15030 = ATCC 35035]